MQSSLNIQDTLAVSGTISSQGGQGSTAGVNTNYGFEAGGGGSGGSIWIITSTLQGSGKIIANGGAGGVSTTNGGSGGGGRIALYYDNIGSGSLSYTAYGGSGGAGSGGAGTTNILTWLEITNAYETSGNLVSPSININGIDRLDYVDLPWNADAPGGTSIKFQLAYSANGNSWSSFIGPDGTASTYFTSSGQAMPAIFDGNKYIKYKVFLTSSDGSNTPKLNDVTINFKALPSIKAVGSTGTIGGRYDLESGKRYSLNGLMDEVGIWNRELSASEILNLYKRGILKLTLSVRSCDDSNCDGNPAIGPDAEVFTGSFNDAATYALLLHKNRYFQYKAVFETENTAYTPSLQKVEVDFVVS